MSIEFRRGNIFTSGADVLVNPTNTDGPMGAGLAKQFAQRFPGLEAQYSGACRVGVMHIGTVYYFRGSLEQPGVVCLATKSTWRSPAKLSYVKSGLEALKFWLTGYSAGEPLTIAVPPLGCGLGGLNWGDVCPLIREHLGDLPGVHVIVYEPY